MKKIPQQQLINWRMEVRLRPKAILIVYQPQHRFRYKKYFLGQGDNIISTREESIVKLIDAEGSLPEYIAIIKITDNLMTLRSLSDVVKILGNMHNKRQIVQLPNDTSYVVQMEKQFFMGSYKCLTQILTFDEMRMIKNVENQQYFDLTDSSQASKSNERSQPAEHSQIQIQKPVNSIAPQQNEKELSTDIKEKQNKGQHDAPESPRSNKTEQIQEEEGGFEATLQLDDCYGGLQPTIDLDNNYEQVPQETVLNTQLSQGKKDSKPQNQQPIPRNLFQNPPKILELSQIPSNVSVQEEEDVSMPDTLNQDQMPATLQEGQQPKPPSPKRHGHDRVSKTVPVNSQGVEDPPKKMRSWQLQKKKTQPEKKIQDFMDLFDVPPESSHKKQHSAPQKPQVLEKEKSVSGSNESKEQGGYMKLHRLKRIRDKQPMKEEVAKPALLNKKSGPLKKSSEEVNSLNDLPLPAMKVAFSSCKMSEFMRGQLRKRGYAPIGDPNEDYDMLIIGKEIKRTKRLLCAILEGKDIKSEGWLSNKQAKIVGKLQGFPWQQIQKIKGRKGTIFKGKYYLTPDLRQEFQAVLQIGGAAMINQLSPGRNKQEISLLISQKDKDIYQKKKNYKKWKIYSCQMVIQSVLVGEEIKEKYLMDQFSFV